MSAIKSVKCLKSTYVLSVHDGRVHDGEPDGIPPFRVVAVLHEPAPALVTQGVFPNGICLGSYMSPGIPSAVHDFLGHFILQVSVFLSDTWPKSLTKRP